MIARPEELVTSDPAPSPLRLLRLTKLYKRRAVLEGVDLEIPAGSVVGLLGKNGEGKTTLIKCALGLIHPDAGIATVLSDPSWDLRAETKARIGYVPQVITLYPWMRVRALVAYVAAFYPRWNDALVTSLLKDWNLDEGAKVGALSVGTLQKLVIILALAPEPELLILDEPAASLDPMARRDFLKALLEIAVDGRRTILFSTHITSDLERVADRVAILRGGRIVYHDALDALKDSLKRIRVIAKSPIQPDILIPGALRTRIEGNEALASVRDFTPELLDQLEKQHAASVRVEELTLEDIFLEMHHA